jgi:chromosome segregation ATPase
LGFGVWGLGFGSQTPNPKPQTPNPKPQTPNPKPQTPNPKPQTPNPKPQTPNPKPQTPNPAMDRQAGGKQANPLKLLDPAARLVLLAMECSRLRTQVDQLSFSKQQMDACMQENEVLRTRVGVLEASLATKTRLQVTEAPLATELAQLRAEVMKKDQEIRRFQSDKQIAQLSLDDYQAKAAYADSLAAKVEEVKNENAKLNKEVLELRLQVDEVVRLKRENSNLSRQLDEILGEKTDSRVDTELLKDYSNRVASLESDNDHLRSRVKELLDRENEHIHRQEIITNLEARLRGLLQEHEEVKGQLAKLAAENSKLAYAKDRLVQYEDSIRKLIEENNRITEVLSDLRNNSKADASAELLKANQNLKLQLDSNRLELDRTRNELKETVERNKSLSLHCSTKAAEASQLEVVLAENGRLANLLADLKKQNTELSRTKEDIKRKLITTEESLKQIQNSYKEKVNSLEEDLQSTTHTVNKHRINLENLEKTNESLREKNSQLLSAEDTVRKLTGENESMKRINADLNQFNSSLTEQLTLIKQELSSKSEIETNYRLMLQELGYLTTTRDTLELKLKSSSQQLASSQKELAELHGQLEQLADSSKQATAFRLEADKYRSLYLETEDRLKQITELETKVDILQSQNRGLHDSNSELRKALLAREPSRQLADVAITVEESLKLKAMIQEFELEHSLLKEREANLKSSLNVAQGRIRALEAVETELGIVSNDKDLLKAQKDELQLEVKRLRGEMVREKEHQGKCLEDFEDKKILRMELESLRLRQADLETRLSQTEAEKIRLTAELRSKVTELTSHNEQLQELLNEEQVITGRQRRDLEDLRDKVLLLEKVSIQHDKTKIELLEKESSLQDYRRKIEALDSEKSTTGQRLESKMQEAHGERERQAAREVSLQKEVEEKNKKLQQLKEENIQFKANEAKRKLLEDEVERLQAQLIESKRKIGDIQSTSGDLSQTQMKLKIAEEDNAALRKRIADMVALMDEMRSFSLDLEIKNKAIPTLQSQIGVLQEELQEKASTVEELKNQLTSLERTTRHKFEVERGTERVLSSRVAELESTNSKINMEQQSLALELESRRLENHRLRAELEASEDLLVEIKRQAKENHGLVSDHHQLITQKEQMAMRVAKLESETSLYKQKLGEALIELERVPLLESDLRKREVELTDLQGRVKELMKLNDHFRSKMSEREAEMEAALAKAEKNRQTLADVNVSHLQAEIAALEKDRNGWKAHCQKLEKSLGFQEQEAQRKSHQLVNEKATLAKQLQEAKHTRSDHEKEIRTLLNEIDGYRQKVDLLEFKLRESYAKLNHFEDVADQSKLQASIVAAKMGSSESALARENKKLAENLHRTNEELLRIKSLADRQSEDLKNKSADIAALRQKLACCSMS